ncbi:MAG: DNA repair protein RadC [Deltaproteobacteria bacterium]|nr:MAG: DNA repair protein RadC [Deltaproteobacteria bacterium]
MVDSMGGSGTVRNLDGARGQAAGMDRRGSLSLHIGLIPLERVEGAGETEGKGRDGEQRAAGETSERTGTMARKGAYDRICFGDLQGVCDRELLSLWLGDRRTARRLWEHFGSLEEIGAASPAELLLLEGIGPATVARLRALRELAHRFARRRVKRGRRFGCARDVFETISPLLAGETREKFLLLPLDAKNRLLEGPVTISTGSLIATVVHPREVFLALIRARAVSAILVHNHPSSGDPEPSPEDLSLTTRLGCLGETAGIRILDHVIIGEETFVSLKDRGLL